MLTYDMRDRGDECLYEHLYRCMRADIESGAIAPGEHLPSKRAFARQLGVSLVTVEGAYAQLVAEGYVRAEPRRGYYACELPGLPSARRRAASDGNAAARPARTESAGAGPVGAKACGDAGPGVIADFTRDPAPYSDAAMRMWARTLRGVVEDGDLARSIEGARPEGLPELRQAIARHLRGFRGMDADPDRIVVGAGAQALYVLIAQLMGAGTTVAIEDPGYRLLAQVYEAAGAACAPVPLDGEGIGMAGLEASGASVAHVMPSHQFPCGLVTSVGRRYQLLAWASEAPDRFIVEDDYDAEFRLAGRPIPALASMDAQGRVIYLNTFSKSLGPALRVAYLVLPGALMDRYRERLGFYASTVSALDQAALARLIDSGDYERHVMRSRTRHRTRRDALLDALRASDPAGALRFEEADSGLHFVLAGPPCTHPASVARRERSIAARAAEAGVLLAPLSGYAFEPARYARWQRGLPGGVRPRFVMRYAGVGEDVMPQAARVIADAMGLRAR